MYAFDLSLWRTHLLISSVLLSVAGRDATKKFRKYHRDSILNRYRERLQVGTLRTDSTRKPGFRAFFASLAKK